MLVFALFSFVFGSTVFLQPPHEVNLAADVAGRLDITVRDSLSGRLIPAQIVSTTADGVRTVEADSLGRAFIEGSDRHYLEVGAVGYQRIRTYFDLDNRGKNVVVWLDPADQQAQLINDAAGARSLDEKRAFFEGYIYDANGNPIAGAEIELNIGAARSKSDTRGFFRLSTNVPSYDAASELPAEAILTISQDGRVVYRRENLQIMAGKTRLVIDVAGEGAPGDGRHRFRYSADEIADTLEQPKIAAPFFTNAPATVPVPASIRVGSNCATATTCTTVNVYSIDTYVRNGLDDEWIASWNANSLKAGAIAYRSYGAYHVFHPRVPASYDICNTTSCQVNDPSDTNVNSNNATTQTTGSIVTNAAGTDALFSEYSAENNLAPGCPDGSTGRPEHSWPCLADPVDVGTTYFGHGRGMCQWGSQRWSINQGKDFVWIVNHYYNANGNPSGMRTGVLQMGPDTLLPPPTLTEPGNQTAPGTSVTTLTPTFSWEPMLGAVGYSLYVSRFNGSTYDVVYNSETALGQPIAGTSFTLPSGILVADGQYRWNMSSYITAGYGTPNFFRNYFTANPSATVSGRVTTPSGSALRNVVVSITDAQGVRRIATTSSFGIYTFTNVTIGQSHTLMATMKRYRFAPLVLTVTGSLSNADLVGLE